MKNALVTGGAKGIGAAICEKLAADGYRVGVLDMDGDAAAALAATLDEAVALRASVTDEASVAQAFDTFGAVPDLVVNNAGIVRFGQLVDLEVDDFRQVVEVNLVGTYIVAREAARRMKAAGTAGSIINLTSINALTPGPGAGAYPATKAGVANMTLHMALELGDFGIRVNCIAPGFVDGGMSAAIYADPKVRAARGGAVPLKRLASVADIANAVAFLASDEGGYINGHQLVVDGGVSGSVLKHLPRE